MSKQIYGYDTNIYETTIGNIKCFDEVLSDNELKEAMENKSIVEILFKQIDQLTNNWNELEEFVKNKMLYAFKNEIGYYKEVLDKMKEIKEGKE